MKYKHTKALFDYIEKFENKEKNYKSLTEAIEDHQEFWHQLSYYLSDAKLEIFSEEPNNT